MNYVKAAANLAMACAVVLVFGTAGAATAAETVAVLHGTVTDNVAPLGPGLAEWVRLQLSAAGASTLPGSKARSTTAGLAGRDRSTSTLLGKAAKAGAGRALLLDLRSRDGRMEIDARLYSTSEQKLVGAAHGIAGGGELTRRAHEVLERIAPAMGLMPGALPQEDEGSIDELSATARALVALDANRLSRAWRELAPFKSSTAVQVRSQIESAAGSDRTSLAERARLLAAKGEAEAGWAMISGRAKAALALPKPEQPDPERAELLLAAGEVLLELGRMREARSYFEKSLAANPPGAEAATLLGKIFRTQRAPDPARKLLRYAARLDPLAIQPLVELAGLEAQNPAQQANYLMRAGKLAATSLQTSTATEHLQRASRLDRAAAPAAHEQLGMMHERVAENINALRAFKQAAGGGGDNVGHLRNLARMQRAMSDHGSAEATLLRGLEIGPQDADLMRQLGQVYDATERHHEAIVQLERALELAPAEPATQRALAQTLERSGDTQRALPLRQSLAKSPEAREDDLMALSLLLREVGEDRAADQALGQAIDTRELSLHVHPGIARDLAERGDGVAAERAQQLAVLMGNDSKPASKQAPAGDDAESRFARLVNTFVGSRSETQPVALLGLREMLPPKELALDWIHLRTPDLVRLQSELVDALARAFDLREVEVGEHRAPQVDQLFQFDAGESRDASSVAALNDAFGTSAVFAARLVRNPGGGGKQGCGDGPYFDVELRSLSGTTPRSVRLLANSACLPGGLEAHGTWNLRAVALYAAAILLVGWLVTRGWGSIIIDFKLPPRSKALFSVSLSKRPRKVKDKSARRRGTSSWLFEKRLTALRRYERRLDGKQTIFKWIPARRRDYYLTVRGPLVDYTNDRLIGDFMEERTIQVKSWQASRLEFDMTPKECAIEVMVTDRGSAVPQARVALKGQSGTLRYAREGAGFLYAGEGEHVVLAGGEDRVAARSVLIETMDPFSLQIDIGDDDALVFAGCAAGVAPYLEGDIQGAADALEGVGQHELASRLRAEWHRDQGDNQAAAAAFEAAGDLTQSAELRSAESDLSGSATLWEEAGEYAKAAAAYRESGDLVAAARAYEEAYDYGQALDCYRELGDTEKVIQLLEASGEFYEAAEEAAEAGQVDRAIRDLQQIDQRHAYYSEACRRLGLLLADRGEVDLAAEKIGEALEISGADNASLEVLERYGKLLEESGRAGDALTIYEKIRRRDLNYGDVNTRIESLRGQSSRSKTGLAQTASTASGSGPGGDDSRYEIIGELGRGGMGVVFKARDRQLGRTVALKVLPENLRDHPHVLELFEREARAAAALNHPNIVTIFDAGREGETVFMTMECLDGVALDAVLKKRGAIPARAVASLGAQVAKGLEYARQAKIVHRDIKPSNLFLTRDKVVKIMDFGLAKTIEEVRRNSTVIGGTPNFMAPEQAAGEPVDHRTDLYSLGASLFQLVTGTPPFQAGDLAYHHRHTALPDPREREASVPAPLALLILKMMEKSPDARVQTPAEVEAALQRMLAST